jgi:AraC family transcriptional regulator
MNVQHELPSVAGTVAKPLDTARRSLSYDPPAATRCICEAAVLMRVEAAIPHAGVPKTSRSLSRWQLNRALQLFETKFDRSMRLAEVADAVRLSKSHFSRAFRHSMGEPPARYLRRHRVMRAQQMMLSTDKSLTNIALDCGFADQSHLTRIFRRMVGATPAAWRRAFSLGPG